ncbi:7-cyano-7-deazaguanine synthase QueC [Lutibacter citreus]|uniref:7-cyano-7-deazaguanine synthase QueC n=1 Tax=Lutibacter citreus TaxID=2138210 RepID=UPI000DBE2BFC|nr:7-cyano-7-deazaguanine synthase QueC [Lutibacter citreus]
MNKEKVILLLSGGIDSTTLLAKLASENYKITCLSFNYNQRNRIELDLASQNSKKYNVSKHIIIDISNDLFESSALVNKELDVLGSGIDYQGNERVNTYVPFRNMVFTTMALSKAESMGVKKIFIAVNKDDSRDYWDCRPSFFNQLNSISDLNSAIKIITPFINYSKKEIVKIAKELDVDLSNTVSCYQPNDKEECGVCLSCMIKQEALVLN